MGSFGTMFSRAILRYLSLNGAAGATELARELGTDPNTARRVLRQLEAYRLVEADVRNGQRRGRAVRFTVKPDRLEELLKSLQGYLLGR